MSNKQKVREFLNTRIKAELAADDDNFFEKGLVNSLFAMQLVAFLEKTFGFFIENDELNIENFQSVNAITAFVDKKVS